MPVFPKSFYTIAAGLATAKATKSLRQTRNGQKDQERIFATLITAYARTKHGSELGISAEVTYAQFTKRIPLQTYETLRPLIERMQQGEADVLWPGQCSLYVRTSGATNGQAKLLPITEAMLQHLMLATKTAAFYYTTRVGHAGAFRGQHLFYNHSSTLLQPIATTGEFVAYEGSLAAITSANSPAWMKRHFYEPGETIAQIKDPRERRRTTAKRTRRRDITLLAGNPHQLLKLAGTICKAATKGKARPLNLQGVWPNLECVVHGGETLGVSGSKLHRICGPEVQFHEVYAASEGLIAAQDTVTTPGLRLISNAGIFYEFLPFIHFRGDRLAHCSPHVIPLAQVKTGVDYVLIMSTPAGLCRYVTGDIVRFTTTTPHRLIPMGRTQLLLNAFGENVFEKQLSDSLIKVCQDRGWTIVNFHVATLTDKQLTGQLSGRHEWWIELEPGTVDTPTGPILSDALDEELRRLNHAYAARRKEGILSAPVVRLVMPGVFAHWLEHNGTWHRHGKIPHCHHQRTIADGLAQLARFSRDE